MTDTDGPEMSSSIERTRNQFSDILTGMIPDEVRFRISSRITPQDIASIYKKHYRLTRGVGKNSASAGWQYELVIPLLVKFQRELDSFGCYAILCNVVDQQVNMRYWAVVICTKSNKGVILKPGIDGLEKIPLGAGIMISEDQCYPLADNSLFGDLAFPPAPPVI